MASRFTSTATHATSCKQTAPAQLTFCGHIKCPAQRHHQQSPLEHPACHMSNFTICGWPYTRAGPDTSACQASPRSQATPHLHTLPTCVQSSQAGRHVCAPHPHCDPRLPASHRIACYVNSRTRHMAPLQQTIFLHELSDLQVCRALRLAGTAVPRTYEADFQRAVYTFRHQRVYNPESRAMEHLRPLPPRGLDPAVLAAPDRAVPPAEGTVQPAESSGQALDFLGPLLPQHLCCQVATGVQWSRQMP